MRKPLLSERNARGTRPGATLTLTPRIGHQLTRGRARLLAASANFGIGALAVGAVWLLTVSSGRAQLAPTSGFGGSPENLRGNLQQFLPAAPAPSVEKAWVVQPSIGIDLGVTDNPGGVRSKGTDFLTVISPSLSLTGDTARATVRLSYSPQATFYASTGSQDQISQNLSGSALLTAIPDTLFLDLRALVSEQSRTGQTTQTGFIQQNNQFLGRDDAILTSSFSATPYLQHRFGGWGTAKVGFSYARTFQDSNGESNAFNGVGSFGTPGYGTLGNLTTERERASFVTGENLGRFNNEITVQATQYSGNGTYRGAYRNEVSNELGYAVTRTITLLGGVGYQDLRFSGTPGYRLSEPTWNAGTRLTPNPDSSITILYGRHDGGTQVSFQGSYAPTARTQVFGSYTTGITTNSEDQQNLLDTTSVGPNGLLVDSVTGAPVSTGSAFGLQNSLSRVRRLSITGVLQLDRDSVAATVVNEQDTTLTNSISFLGNAIPTNTRTNSTIGSLTWQHELNPVTSVFSSVSYGVVDNGALLGNASAGAQSTFGVSAGLSHTFTDTLTGHVNYSYSERTGGQGRNIPASFGGNSTQNLLLVGIRKSF